MELPIAVRGTAGRSARPAILLALAAFTLGAQTTSIQFAAGLTTPQGGVVLTGTGINPATGQLFRHLWSADPVNGLCRLDPDIDSPGPHAINAATCLTTVVNTIALNAGTLSFDPATNDIYAVDNGGKNGIFRLHYLPSGDSGHGLLDSVHQEILGAGCNISGNQPTAASLGPDGNLYVGFKRVGSIMRILSPQTEPLPCSNVQSQVMLISSSDQGLGWTGHTLFVTDKRITDAFSNADACFTPVQGNNPCNPSGFLNILPNIMTSDQVYPSANGKNIFVSQTNSITRFSTATGTTFDYGGLGFSLISAFAVDGANLASPVLFVGDDPSNGLTPGTGRWFQISNAPPPPAPPGTPTNVTASAGDTVATVSWAPAVDGQPVTSFTVHNSFVSGGVAVPDVLVTATAGTTIVPTSVTVTGLADGISYQFEVRATNSLGSSALSAPSNTVTPFAVTPPGAPTNVVALPGDASASVGWTAPPSNGAPITSYTVTALVAGAPTGITAIAGGTATNIVVSGLTNGTTYTFTVAATNSAGTGPASAQSGPVTPAPAAPVQAPDLSISMSGPLSATFAANATYTLTIVNNSASVSAPQVDVSDTLPLAVLMSATASQGSCSAAAGVLTCQLGSMAGGAVATVTVVLNLSGTITNQASVVALDAGGSPFTDATPSDNTASVTTTVTVPPSTTDVQTTGSAQNGGPAHGTADTFTWQIKDNQSVAANGVTFTTTLPASFQFASAGANAGGACTTPAQGSLGGVITCRTATLPGGQTMTVVVNFVPTVIGTIPTTGSATFTGTDTNTANNSFTVTIQVK